MALNTKQGMLELKEILLAMNFFQEVSTGKIPEITAQDTFPSAYLNIDGDINERNGKMGASEGCEYDRKLLVTITVHLDTENKGELYHLDVRDDIETAVLRDSQLWNAVVDRDVLGSRWDANGNLPKKEGEIGIELFVRASV